MLGPSIRKGTPAAGFFRPGSSREGLPFIQSHFGPVRNAGKRAGWWLGSIEWQTPLRGGARLRRAQSAGEASASGASILGQWNRRQMLTPFASLRSKVGSTESRPTKRAPPHWVGRGFAEPCLPRLGVGARAQPSSICDQARPQLFPHFHQHEPEGVERRSLTFGPVATPAAFDGAVRDQHGVASRYCAVARRKASGHQSGSLGIFSPRITASFRKAASGHGQRLSG